MRKRPEIDGFAQPDGRFGFDQPLGPNEELMTFRDGVARFYSRDPRTSEQVEASLSPAARAEFARFRAS